MSQVWVFKVLKKVRDKNMEKKVKTSLQVWHLRKKIIFLLSFLKFKEVFVSNNLKICNSTDLVASLIDVSGSVVVHSEHGYEAVGHSVGACDVSALGSDTVSVEPNTSGRLWDQCTLLQCVVYTVNTVISHSQQKTAETLIFHCSQYGMFYKLKLMPINRPMLKSWWASLHKMGILVKAGV